MLGTAVGCRVITVGVFNRHSEVHADTKSYQWMIYTKAPSAQEAENFMEAGKVSRVISAAELHY